MENQSSQTVRVLRILWSGMLMGPVSFALIALYLVESGKFNTEAGSLSDILKIVVPALALAGIISSFMIYSSKVKAAKDEISLKTKLDAHRGAIIMRAALMEIPSVFAIIAYLLTGNIYLLAVSGIIILIFLVLFPTKEKLIKDLELTTTEEMNLD